MSRRGGLGVLSGFFDFGDREIRRRFLRCGYFAFVLHHFLKKAQPLSDARFPYAPFRRIDFRLYRTGRRKSGGILNLGVETRVTIRAVVVKRGCGFL